MTETFYAQGNLNEGIGFISAFVIGGLFGFILERVGFGSAKKLSGVFYLRDMVVIKFMLTALTTTAIGYSIFLNGGYVGPENIYLLPTVFGGYIVGGTIFGIGFAMAGWCPGTAAVGLASGKYDAGIFLVGVVSGSILFNELFSLIEPLYNWGDVGVVTIYETFGISRASTLVLLAVITVVAIIFCEWIDGRQGTDNPMPAGPKAWATSLWQVALTATNRDRALRVVLLVFLFLPMGLLLFTVDDSHEQQLLAEITKGEDHIDPIDLARRIMQGDETLMLVDVRPSAEFEAFHLKGASNIQLPDLHQALGRYKNAGDIILYSNGMTHPAQARDSLQRSGYDNAYLLTDGLDGFIDRCLTPVSLRNEPVPEPFASEIRAWRRYFLTPIDNDTIVVSQNTAANPGH